MKLIVLMSCMHQSKDIIKKSNIQTDAIVINQCDTNAVEEFDFLNKKNIKCHVQFISTTDRGLSRSRNMAIRNSWGDIGLFSDDDELFQDDYESIILSNYQKNPNVDIYAFAFKGMKSIPQRPGKLSFRQLCSTSSIQLTFKIDKIKMNNIQFDVMMGSGTGNGAGEEVKFMMECKRKGFNMVYNPSIITELLPGESHWFTGRNAKYLRDTGWSAHRSFGLFLGLAFINYHIICHYSDRYKDQMSFIKAYYLINKGFWENR